MNKIYQLKFSVFLAVTLFFVCPALAADISFDTPSQVGVNQNFKVEVLLDTEMEDINAVEGKIVYDKNILTLKEVRDANNIISLWVKDPAQNKNTGIVEFSGITPGGYNSFTQTKSIFSLIFSAKIEGEASLKIEDIIVLLNDGNGTQAKTTITKIDSIKITENFVSSENVSMIEDKESPEPLFVEIIKDKSIADNQWVVVFYGQDKKSGIDHFEIAEQKGDQVSDYTKLSWQSAQSPQLLSDQTRESFVYIKGVDRAGNEVVAVVPPAETKKLYKNFWFWCIILLSLLLLFGGSLWKRKKRSSRY